MLSSFFVVAGEEFPALLGRRGFVQSASYFAQKLQILTILNANYQISLQFYLDGGFPKEV